MDAQITDDELVRFTLDGRRAPADAADRARSFIDEQVVHRAFGVLVDARQLEVDDARPSALHKTAMRLSDLAVTYDQRCIGAAFMAPTVLRSSLGSVLRMKSWDIPHAIFADESAASDWLRSLYPRDENPVSSAVEQWLG